MPKRGKLTKQARDHAMIAGIRKHPEYFDEEVTRRIVTKLEAHIETLRAIDHYEALKREAVARERQQEKALLPDYNAAADFVRNEHAHGGPSCLDYGVKPRKKGVMSAATKAAAAAKRRATRAIRGTMGPKQRKRMLKKLRGD